VGFEVVAAVQAGSDYQLFATPVKVGAMALQTHHKAMLLVPVSILAWLVVTFLTRPVERGRLDSFYRQVRPGGWWGPVAADNGDVQCDGFSWGRLGVWAAGSAGVYGFLFGLGKLVLGDAASAVPLFLLAVAGGLVVARELRRT
jgi:hypothetical protein